MVVDSHCHLDLEAFDADRDAVLERARGAGVEAMVTICTRLTRFGDVLALARANPDVWCSAGVHPHHAAEEPEARTEDLISCAADPRVVGIGETGLDYHYDLSPRDVQARSFRAHVAAARETGLPLIVHNRDSDADMARILEEEMAVGSFSCVLHCFSAGRRLAELAVELGFYISLSGILTFRNAEGLRAIVSGLPVERLLVETDSPYLAPTPNRGRRNEPSFVVHTAAELARVMNVGDDEIEMVTTENFYSLFNRVIRKSKVASEDRK